MGPLAASGTGAGEEEGCSQTGIAFETRADFGSKAPVGTTGEPRLRRIAARLSLECARRLFSGQQGIGDQTPNEVIAEGLQDGYFQDYGRRASGLEAEFAGIDYIDYIDFRF
ncbi:hypothetical protein AB0C81_29045 [Streptomyces roseoverticillatus]|uniref:telomere-protecting terminal protein Tpg n=1 Tax=Streptomyces roseoverticillatus TaxID=66429 RepID=UPI0033F0ED11